MIEGKPNPESELRTSDDHPHPPPLSMFLLAATLRLLFASSRSRYFLLHLPVDHPSALKDDFRFREPVGSVNVLGSKPKGFLAVGSAWT